MKKLTLYILAAILGLWVAATYVPNVSVTVYPDTHFFGFNLTANWQVLVLLGIILGLINYFVKPVLDVITLPIRIITLGFFGFIIDMGLIWAVDIMFKEFSAPLIYPLLDTTLIVWGLATLLSIFTKD